MRLLSELRQYRRLDLEIQHYGDAGDDYCGVFVVWSPTDRRDLLVIASAGDGWDHVSVSRETRIPNYLEMDHVKRLFFCDDECAMQLHVEVGDHVNNHPRCLHLWRPHHVEIPRPPSLFVGVASMSPDEMEALVESAAVLGIRPDELHEWLVEKAKSEGQ